MAEAEIALGGVAPRTIMAPLTMAGLQGRTWNKETLHAAIASLAQDVYINSQSPGLPPNPLDLPPPPPPHPQPTGLTLLALNNV